MNRKDFLTQACSAGLCSCTVAALFSSTLRAETQETKKEEKKPEKPKEDWRVGFAQERYAVLLGALEEQGDKAALEKALEKVGQHCASKASMLKNFAGDPKTLFQEMRNRWHAEVDYDEQKGLVKLSFGTGESCPCALVKTGTTPPSVCQCSLGWQQYAMSTIFKRPVKIELKESLLRGGKKCAFEVQVV